MKQIKKDAESASMSMTADQALQQAIAHHRAARLQDAERLYRAILQAQPDHPDANHNLGVLAVQAGQPAAALPHFKAALEVNPNQGQYWSSYIDALIQTGSTDEARQVLAQGRQRGLQGKTLESLEGRLAENEPTTQEKNSLADLFNEGKYADAIALARELTIRFPLHGFGWNILGSVYGQMGRSADALEFMQKAAMLSPRDASAHNNLGNILRDLGRLNEAEANFRQAFKINPYLASAHYNLGNTLKDAGELVEAEDCYRRALEIKPDYDTAYNNLGNILLDLGRSYEAEVCSLHALEINPDYAEAHSNLGGALKELGRLDEAMASFHQALKIKSDFAEAHSNLGALSAFLSDFEKVVTESDNALQLKPDDASFWESRLYSFSYHPDLSAEEIYREFVRWGDRFPDPVVDFSTHDRTPGRRLRIGYVSPDFRRHTSRFYFWPLFANHDHAVVELFAYSNVKVEDGLTAGFKGLFDHWRNIRGVDDDDVARMVRQDGIDILVDCCNHMLDDRLGVFTLKPAPIQATWLGAAWTTGLKMIDYALIDPYMAPEGTLTRETIVRLPHCFVAYHPPEETAEIAPPPSLKNGYITFGYSGRTERLNHRTFRVWGEILRHNPTARLILDFRAFTDPPTQAHYRQFMEKHGVDISRVIMRRSENIFAGLNDIDILLDCFPHSGGTMLFDALWMGVPILTLAGRPPVGRIGTSLMINLGLPEWVAYSEEEYICKAGFQAQNVQALAQLRAGMRERMQSSPVMDGAGFARGMEAAYRQMFEKWTAHNAEDNRINL